MEFGIESVAILVMKSGKWHQTDGMKLTTQDKIRTLGEREKTYKYLSILEPYTIKQVEIKEKKIRKSISEEAESYLRQNYVAEILSKEKKPGLYPR